MENVDFNNKFWPSTHDGVQTFITEIKNQLILISNIRLCLRKRCKLYESFIKDLQKCNPSKEEMMLQSCQSYSIIFIQSLDSEARKLIKSRSDTLQVIELLDKADSAYASFKDSYTKQYARIITESGNLVSLNNSIGALVDSYKTGIASLKKLQEENHKDQHVIEKQLKKIVKDLPHAIDKREKSRLNFISLVEEIIPALKTLSISILDTIDSFCNVWTLMAINLLVVSDDTGEIENAVHSLDKVGVLEKILANISSRGYPPRKIEFNPDSPDNPLILDDGTAVDDTEIASIKNSTKDRSLRKTNSSIPSLSAKKSFDNTESKKTIQPSDADTISIENKSLTSLQTSKSTPKNEVEAFAVPNSFESLDAINELSKSKPIKTEGKSFFYIPPTPNPEEKVYSHGFDSDEDKDKKKDSFDDSDDPGEEPAHKYNIVIKPCLSDHLVSQPSNETANAMPIINPPSPSNQHSLANRRALGTNLSSQDKNIIKSSISNNQEKSAISSNSITSNNTDLSSATVDPKNLFSKSNEKLPTPFNPFGSTSVFYSKSNDPFSNPIHTTSQANAIAPKDDLFSNLTHTPSQPSTVVPKDDLLSEPIPATSQPSTAVEKHAPSIKPLPKPSTSKPSTTVPKDDLLSKPIPTTLQPSKIVPKDDLVSNKIDLSTKINSQASYSKQQAIDKVDNSSLTENSIDFLSDKNKQASISYDMISISTHPLTEGDPNLKTVDSITQNNDMETSSHSSARLSKELDPFSSNIKSLFSVSNSDVAKKYITSFKITEILSSFTKQQITKYSLKGNVTFSLSNEDVQTLALLSAVNFPKLSFTITHNDTFTNKFSSASSLVENAFKAEKSKTIFNIDESEFMLILNKFMQENKSDQFIDIPLLDYEISSPKLSVKPYSIVIEPPLIEEKKVIICVSIICAPLDAWCAYYPEFSVISKNAIVSLAANRIRSKHPLKIESLLPSNKFKWSPESKRLQWVIRELISHSKTSLSVSSYQFKITISSDSQIDLDDESKVLGVAITFNLDDTLVSSKNITISDTSNFYLNSTKKKLSSGAYLTEV